VDQWVFQDPPVNQASQDQQETKDQKVQLGSQDQVDPWDKVDSQAIEVNPERLDRLEALDLLDQLEQWDQQERRVPLATWADLEHLEQQVTLDSPVKRAVLDYKALQASLEPLDSLDLPDKLVAQETVAQAAFQASLALPARKGQ